MKMINPKYILIPAIGIGSILNLVSVLLSPNVFILINVIFTLFGFEILYYKLSKEKLRWVYILLTSIFIELLTSLGLIEVCSIYPALEVCKRNPFIISSFPLTLIITFFLAYFVLKMLENRKT